MTMLPQHPSADELRAFGQGQLAPEAADALERHIGECETCCRVLAEAPADSFESQLREARRGEPLAATTDGTASTLAEAPGVPPELLDHPRYRVLGLVGQGGMGAVYRAEHRHMERLVALKVINPGLIRNPATVQRFRQEVRAAARLHHPNIVTAHDADQAGGLHFLVMEYVEGESLAELVRQRGPLPVAEACEYARQAARGLQHAHEQGMVHRDIKPQNLMVVAGGARSASEGVVKILDFGLARLPRTPDGPAGEGVPAAALTGAGAVMGTADYIAPEQADDPRAADIRADIYALGCTLYHLLAGRPPFPEGSVPEKLARHAREPLPPLPDVPTGLAAVLARMTAKDPAGRFATPAEVARALAPFCVPGGVRPPARKRLRRAVAAAALLAAGLLAGGIVLRLQTDRGEIVVQTDDRSLELAVRKNGEVIRVRDPQSGQAWDVDAKHYQIAAADQPDGLVIELPGRGTITLRRKGGGAVTVTTGPRGVPAAGQPKVVRVVDPAELAKRPSAADALKRSDIPRDALAYLGGGDPEQVPPELVAVLGDTRFRTSGRPGPMAFTADGKTLAVADDRDVAIRFLDVPTGRLLRQLPLPFRYRMAFSPDGRRLAGTWVGGLFRMIDARTGHLLWQLEKTRLRGVDNFAFSADGKLVYLSSKMSAIVEQRDTETGEERRFWNTKGEGTADFAASPDGSSLVFIDGTGNNTRAGVLDPDWPPWLGSGGVRVAFSPDGKHFAVAWSGKDTPARVTIHDARRVVIHTLPTAGDEFLAFTPDGKTLVAVSRAGNISISRWNVADGKRLSSVTLWGVFLNFDLALSRDGKTLARQYRDQFQIDLYDTETGKPRYRRSGMGSSIAALAFSADGRLLASSDRHQTRLWDLSTARERAMWSECPYHRLAFSPDGKLLAGASGTSINLHRLSDGQRIHLLDPKTDQIESIAFSPDGSLLAATAGGDTVRVWRVSDGEEVRVLSYPKRLCHVLFSPDGSRLLAAGHAGIKVWDARTGLEVKHLLGTETFYLLEWLPDGKTLAARTGGYLLHIDAETGKAVRKQTVPGGLPLNRPSFPANVFSPGGRLLCESELRGFVLTQLDPAPERRRTYRLSPQREPSSTAWRAAAFSPDGRYLACGNPEGVISLLRLSEKGKVPELQVHAPTARELAERPNAADALKAGDVPEAVRAYVGGGDPRKAPPELVAVLGDVRFRCPQPRSDSPLVYSPDGKLLALLCRPDTFLLDARTGRLLRKLDAAGWDGGVERAVFSPDGRYLAGWRINRKLRLWETASGRPVRTFDAFEHTGAVAFFPDGKHIAACDPGCWGIVVFEMATGKRVGGFNNRQGVLVIDAAVWPAHPDGPVLAFVRGAGDGLIDLWKGVMGPRPALWKTIKGFAFAFSPDGKYLAACTATVKGGVQLYDTQGNVVGWLDEPGKGPLAFTADGKALVVVEPQAKQGPYLIKRWDVATRKELARVSVPWRGWNGLCTVSPDGGTLAALTTQPSESIPRLIDTATGKERFHDPGHAAAIKALAFSPDGKLLASSDGPEVRLWDLATGKTVRAVDIDKAERVGLLAFSPDSRTLVTAGNWVNLWNVADGRHLRSLATRPGHTVTALAFSPDGKLLATAGKDHTASLWNVADGREVRILGHSDVVRDVAFTPDGKVVVCATADGLKRWQTAGGLARGTCISDIPPEQVGFLGGGQILVALGTSPVRDRTYLRLWDLDGAGSLVARYAIATPARNSGVSTLAPAGNLVAVSCENAAVCLWQPGAGSGRSRSFRLSPSDVPPRVAFSPDGRYLAVGNPDGTICLLRLAERGQVPRLPE